MYSVHWLVLKCFFVVPYVVQLGESQCNFAFSSDLTIPTAYFAEGYCNQFLFYGTNAFWNISTDNGYYGHNISWKVECVVPEDDLPFAQFVFYNNSALCEGDPSIQRNASVYACDLECQPPCNIYSVEQSLHLDSDCNSSSIYQTNKMHLVDYPICMDQRIVSVTEENGYNYSIYGNDDCSDSPFVSNYPPNKCVDWAYSNSIFTYELIKNGTTDLFLDCGDIDDSDQDTDAAICSTQANGAAIIALGVMYYYFGF